MLDCSDYRPSAGLLRDSLAKRSREFVLENSLHVVPYFIDPSRSIYESVHVTGRSEGPPIYGQQPTYVMSGPSSIQLSLTVTKTASSLRFLTRSQRKCDFPEESPSHVHCERAHVEKTFKSKCGCLPWFYASGQAEDCPLSKYQCLSEIDSKQLADPNCHMSCDHTAYNCEKIERAGDSSEVRFLSWPDVRFRRSTRFGWLDLLVSFGGVAGCFLGYSIITSLEGLYYFTLRTYCGAVLGVPKSRFNVQVQPRDVKRLQGEAKERVAADGFSDQLKLRYLKDY